MSSVYIAIALILIALLVASYFIIGHHLWIVRKMRGGYWVRYADRIVGANSGDTWNDGGWHRYETYSLYQDLKKPYDVIAEEDHQK